MVDVARSGTSRMVPKAGHSRDIGRAFLHTDQVDGDDLVASPSQLGGEPLLAGRRLRGAVHQDNPHLTILFQHAERPGGLGGAHGHVGCV